MHCNVKYGILWFLRWWCWEQPGEQGKRSNHQIKISFAIPSVMTRIQHNWWLASLKQYPILKGGVTQSWFLLLSDWSFISGSKLVSSGNVRSIMLNSCITLILDTKATLLLSLFSRSWSDCRKRLTDIHKGRDLVWLIIPPRRPFDEHLHWNQGSPTFDSITKGSIHTSSCLLDTNLPILLSQDEEPSIRSYILQRKVNNQITTQSLFHQ